MADKLSVTAHLGSRALLDRILEQPALVAAIESLPAAALGKLINQVGLEDAGELVALATVDQLRGIFDEDLWHSERPGQDESFAADRFSRWLEILLEAGEDFAARRIVEMSEDLFTLALHKQVLVVDIDALAVEMSNRRSDQDALVEKALESCLCEEIGQYRLIARHHEGWDALLSVLLVLDRDHHDYLDRVLERCCFAAHEYIEENGGLYDVLSAEAMLEEDAAAEREDRRAEAGYVSPSSAASFLALARTVPVAEVLATGEVDPITRAYFRNLHLSPGPGSAVAAPTTRATTSATDDLVELLREAEVLPPARAVALLPASTSEDDPRDVLGRALRSLAVRAPDQHARRMAELGYVTNVLHAGCSIGGRRLRAAEAAHAAVAIANLGLSYCIDQHEGSADAALARGADKVFRVGYRLLMDEAALPVARALAERLGGQGKRQGGAPTVASRAASALRAALTAGKPWIALPQLRSMGQTLPAAVLAAIDECPHRPTAGAASAPEPSSQTATIFVATRAELVALGKTIDQLPAG